MGHHYLHINPDIKTHLAHQLPQEGWIESIVSDLTESGTQLTALVLTPNEYGPQIALYGDRFYARGCVDKFRTDALWVYRVEAARNPNQVPIKIPGRFEALLPGRTYIPGDHVASLFSVPASNGARADIERALRLKPSPRLSKVLAAMAASVRAAWRPSLESPELPSTDDFLRMLRSLWSRYRLQRFAAPSLREEWLLRGQLTTDTLQLDERLALVALVDIGTLNSLVASADTAGLVMEELLRRLADLVPPSDVRAVIWGSMLAGTSDIEIRDEIRSAAAGLKAIVQQGVIEHAWTRATLEGLSAAASRNGDAAIAELLQAVEGDPHPLLGIASWAERLEFVSGPESALTTGSQEAAEATIMDPGGAEPTAVEAAEIQPTGPTLDSGEHPPARWALDKTVGDLEPFITAVERLKVAALACQETPVNGPNELLATIALVEELAASARLCLEQLPSAPQLAVGFSEAARAYADARVVLGDAFDPGRPPFDALSVLDLREVIRLVQAGDELAIVPAWAWGAAGTTEALPSSLLQRSQRLCDSSTRRLVNQIATLIRDYADVSPSAIVKISPPPAHVAPDEHVRLELEQLRLAAQRLQRIPAEHREWMQLALARGDDEEETLQMLDRFEALSMRLSSETARTLRDDVVSLEEPASRDKRLHQLEQAVKFFEESLGGAVDVTFTQLIKRVGKMDDADVPARLPTHELTVDHDWVGVSKTRAPLAFVPHEDPHRPYGFVSVPIAIHAHRRWEYHLRIDARVRTRQRGQSWLLDWDRHVPETLDISVQDWRRAADGRFLFTFELRIAIRRPERSTEAFEFILQLSDGVSGRLVAPEKPFRWESTEPTPEPLAFDWPGGIHPDYVRAHPVGPQKRLSKIEARLRSGNSFAIVAPRRFGKTTLVAYLRERAADLGLLCPEQIACTSFTDDRGAIDLAQVWRTVAENLQSALQCTVSSDVREDVPSRYAFDRARRAAAEEGWKGVLLLFDESQLLFASAGWRLGDRLKDLLELHWMTKPTPDTVPLLFGFVGLPTFSENVGVNFRNLLEPEEGWEMDDGDINRIILGVTKNKLHTTREARQHLAQAASNLYLARILVESLKDRADTLKRLWVNYDDVAAVQAEIAQHLEQGRHGNIAGLVRDSLNDSTDVNKWIPSPSYPVALALASARHDGVRGAQPLAAHARQRLNAWCDDQQLGSGKPNYREEDVKRHLDRLGELGVFDRSGFRSRFVEAWLLGEVREGFPPSAINALVKGASTIVSVPQLLEPVERDGGQARIFRFTRDGTQYALRLANLETETERNRFLETVATLKVLTTGVPRAEPGIQYVFDLDAVGFSERDEMVGVHVYRWIEGHDLDMKLGQLPAGLVSEIGMKLAIALQLLHRYRINHRDVRPKNIVLAHQTKDPVLIDFGLAKFDGGPSVTRVSNDYTAPEVSQHNPRWTPAADIYALGATLQALLGSERSDQAPLRELLDRMKAAAADQRPEAAELVTAFDSLRARYLVDHQLRGLLDRIDAAVTQDSQRKWYPPVVDKFKQTFRMLALGLHTDMFDRCAELADFLNQVLEAYPTRRGGTQLRLGYIKNQNDDTGRKFQTASIDVLHQLRVSLSHGNTRLSKSSVMRKLQMPSDEQLRRWMLEGATLISDHLGLRSLATVVTEVI